LARLAALAGGLSNLASTSSYRRCQSGASLFDSSSALAGAGLHAPVHMHVQLHSAYGESINNVRTDHLVSSQSALLLHCYQERTSFTFSHTSKRCI
jgi:hypothetical protein